MKRRKSLMPLFLGVLIPLVCLSVIFYPRLSAKLKELNNLPKTYAEPLSFEETVPGQTTKYVIALDNSTSMEDVVAERNAAARALIYSLPCEKDIQATLFFFTAKTRAPLDLLPMGQPTERQKLLDLLDDEMEALGGTNLANMLETALEKFGDGQNERRVLFAVTDGSNYGTSEEVAERDKAFFQLCEDNQDKVDIYIVYVSEDAVPEKLEEGLHTKAITLEEDSEDAISRLTVWEEEETAKILLIPDFDDLEAALMNLRFSDTGAVFNRKIEESGTISFPVFPLCAQEITISLSGGASARDSVRSIKVDGEEDLLSREGVEFTDSMITLRSQKGLPAGLYTMDVSANQPFSMVIACKYNYQFRYGFLETEDVEELPAGQDITLHMLVASPDGDELPADDSVALSMNVYCQDASGELSLLWEIQNKGTLPGELLKDGGSLELRPVVAYGGVKVEREQGWTVWSTDMPPTLKDRHFFKPVWFLGSKETSLCKVKDVAADRETPAEDIRVSSVGEDGPLLRQEGDTLFFLGEGGGRWPFWQTYRLSATAMDASGQTALAVWSVQTVAVLPILLGIVCIVIAVILLTWMHRVRKRKREAKEQTAAKERRDRRVQEQAYREELKVDEEIFIRAGLCWTLRDEQGETTHIGGLGLTNEEGWLQGGCDLTEVPVYCLDEAGKVTDCENPLPFGLWRYSTSQKCTELLLPASLDVSDCGVKELKRVVKSPPETTEGDIMCFGVNQTLPRREVRLKTDQGTFTFRLEYYTDQPPFYF